MAYLPLSGQVAYASGLQLVDEILTNVAKQFRPEGYIYDDLVAPQLVQYNIGLYPKFNPNTYFATGGSLNVSDKAPTPLIDFDWSTETYQCVDYRLATQITRKEMAQAHPALRLDYSKTVGLLSVFANNREQRLANALKATANSGSFTANGGASLSPSAAKWDNGTSGSPAAIQTDIQKASLLVKADSGIKPNTLAMDEQVAWAIANDYTVKQQLQYRVGPEMLQEGPRILPQTLFGLSTVIAGVMVNNARPANTASLTGTWGTSARVMYINPNAQWGIPSCVYAFRGRVSEGVGETQPPSGILPTGQGGQEPGPAGSWALVDRWWELDPPIEKIRAWECVTEKVVGAELGVEIASTLNSPIY